MVALGYGLIPVGADVVAQEHPDVVFLDFPLVLVRRLKNDVAAPADFLGGGAGDQPAVADPANPAGGGGTAAANPDRGRWFEAGFGRDADVVAGEELALVGYVVLFPQAAHQADGLVGAAAAVILGDAASLVLLDFLAAQTDGGEAAALGQEVQGGDLLGEDDRVAQGQGEDAGAELHPVGPGGNHGKGHHRFQAEAVADDAVAEPDGVVAVLVAEFHQAAEEVGVVAPLSVGAGDVSDGNAHSSSLIVADS